MADTELHSKRVAVVLPLAALESAPAVAESWSCCPIFMWPCLLMCKRQDVGSPRAPVVLREAGQAVVLRRAEHLLQVVEDLGLL